MPRDMARHRRTMFEGIASVTISYEEARERWRRAQPADIIRSLAYDYRQGLVAEDTEDAYLEYKRRWPGGELSGNDQVRQKRTGGLARCDAHYRGRRPFSCKSCMEAETAAQVARDAHSHDSSGDASQAPDELPSPPLMVLDHPLISEGRT